MENEAQYVVTNDLTVDEMARICQVHAQTIRNLAKKGKIPGAYKLGAQWRIPRAAFDKMREGTANYG